MATYEQDCTADLDGMPSPQEINDMMVMKAHELFGVCDTEEKGFITKRDMQRLQTELPLSPDQLENVFDSLDQDGNGFLTLEEFTGGFGSFLGLTPTIEKQDSICSSHGSEKVYENEHIDSEEDEETFTDLLESLDAHGVFEDQEVIKSVWSRIRKEEPELQGSFEEFLSRVTNEIKKSHSELTSLEGALRNKTVAHDEEVRKLYEEMEHQIRAEREKILAEEKARERQMREEMEKELFEKERMLSEVLNKQQEMEEKLVSVNSIEGDAKVENEKLLEDKEHLERNLEQITKQLEESRAYINTLRSKQRDEKRERAMAALKISEGIAMERESLVKQLDMLRDMNKKLRDDRDEKESHWGDRASNYYTANLNAETDEVDNTENSVSNNRTLPSQQSIECDEPRPIADHHSRRKQLAKQGSVLSNYFMSGPHGVSTSSHRESIEEDDLEVEMMDDPFTDMQSQNNNSVKSHSLTEQLNETEELQHAESLRNSLAMTKREEPVGANASTEVSEPVVDISKMTPERLFKVVFVGDSGVGKSSFIFRFCSDDFKDSFNATIGVDFQVKNLLVDNHLISLQLWDTAGQERFRSITKQYFRKADGVLVMYDVNSETSFTNVRNWIGSVQEGVEEGTVLMLVGNKTDLVNDESQQVIRNKDGARLAKEYDAIFFETSAKSGGNVTEAMQELAKLLREKEDRQMENALSLKEDVKKKKVPTATLR